MIKNEVYTWLFNIVYKNGLNKKEARTFAINYTEDKTALKDMIRRFKNHIFKKQIEITILNSIQLQQSVKFEQDNIFKNFKSTYCCSNFYNGNKKKCDICNRDLKF